MIMALIIPSIINAVLPVIIMTRSNIDNVHRFVRLVHLN